MHNASIHPMTDYLNPITSSTSPTKLPIFYGITSLAQQVVDNIPYILTTP